MPFAVCAVIHTIDLPELIYIQTSEIAKEVVYTVNFCISESSGAVLPIIIVLFRSPAVIRIPSIPVEGAARLRAATYEFSAGIKIKVFIIIHSAILIESVEFTLDLHDRVLHLLTVQIVIVNPVFLSPAAVVCLRI